MVKIGNNVREAGWSACNRAFLGIGAVGGLPGFPLWDLAQLSGLQLPQSRLQACISMHPPSGWPHWPQRPLNWPNAGCNSVTLFAITPERECMQITNWPG